MTIAFRNAAQNDGGGGLTFVIISKPTGTVQNDVMVAHIASLGATTVTPPTGWTQITRTALTQSVHTTFYKVAGASEPTTYTFDAGVGGSTFGAIYAYSGVDTANPINVSGTATVSANGTTVATPSLTATRGPVLILSLLSVRADAGGTWGTPTGTTGRVTGATGEGAVYSVGGADEAASAGATTSRTGTLSVSKVDRHAAAIVLADSAAVAASSQYQQMVT